MEDGTRKLWASLPSACLQEDSYTGVMTQSYIPSPTEAEKKKIKIRETAG